MGAVDADPPFLPLLIGGAGGGVSSIRAIPTPRPEPTMNATVEFTIYGPTLKAIETQAILALQELGGSDQMWDVRYNLSTGIVQMNGTVIHWKADVYAHTRSPGQGNIGYWEGS